MCAVPGSDAFVMAGTVYPDHSDMSQNYIQFLHVSADGTPLHIKLYDILDEDERAVISTPSAPTTS